MSVGSDLRQARELKGITLEQVSRKTKISVKYLESIESDQYDVFPSHTYAKGFLRAIAKIVGLDPVLITRQFEEEVAPRPVPIQPTVDTGNSQGPSLFDRRKLPDLEAQPTPQDFLISFDEEAEASRKEETVPLKTEPFLRRDKSLTPPGAWKKPTLQGASILAALAILYFAWDFMTSHPIRCESKPKPVVVETPVPTLEPTKVTAQAVAAKPTAVPTAVPAMIPAKVPTRVPTAVPTPVPAKKREEPKKAVKPGEREPRAKQAPVTFNDRYHHIVLKGREESYVFVGMDGVKTWEFMLKKDDVQTFKAKEYFTLKVGNAGGVDLWYDGEPQGELGPPSKVVDLRLPPEKK